MAETQQSDSVANWIKLILAWGFVGIPLVCRAQTLLNAVKAF